MKFQASAGFAGTVLALALSSSAALAGLQSNPSVVITQTTSNGNSALAMTAPLSVNASADTQAFLQIRRVMGKFAWGVTGKASPFSGCSQCRTDFYCEIPDSWSGGTAAQKAMLSSAVKLTETHGKATVLSASVYNYANAPITCAGFGVYLDTTVAR